MDDRRPARPARGRGSSVRRLAALLLLLTLVGGTSVATYAHPDTLGAPDPQWQRFPDAPAETDVQRPVDDGAPVPGDGVRVLEAVVCAVATLAVLLALSLARSFWSARRPSGAGASVGAEHGRDSRERA